MSAEARRMVQEMAQAVRRKTQKEIMQESGGAGVYAMNYRDHWMLREEDWKSDHVPEIMDGKNVADYYDPDIMAKLDELEREEEEMIAGYEEGKELGMAEDEDLTEEQQAQVAAIREKKSKIVVKRRIARGTMNNARLSRRAKGGTAEEFVEELGELGVDATEAAKDASSRRARSRSRKRSSSRGPMEEEEEDAEKKRKRSASRALSQGAGYRSVKQKVDAEKSAKRVQREFKKSERTAESDRKIAVKRPKHLFSGKRDIRKASTQGR
uniref:NOG C-terminal domain-containing protein n=1 Tax=Palpitomonas bilix TaxID=652834 RepID=A0A7S3DFQ6_9EUKA